MFCNGVKYASDERGSPRKSRGIQCGISAGVRQGAEFQADYARGGARFACDGAEVCQGVGARGQVELRLGGKD